VAAAHTWHSRPATTPPLPIAAASTAVRSLRQKCTIGRVPDACLHLSTALHWKYAPGAPASSLGLCASGCAPLAMAVALTAAAYGVEHRGTA
jgi:hypothetical protein